MKNNNKFKIKYLNVFTFFSTFLLGGGYPADRSGGSSSSSSGYPADSQLLLSGACPADELRPESTKKKMLDCIIIGEPEAAQGSESKADGVKIACINSATGRRRFEYNQENKQYYVKLDDRNLMLGLPMNGNGLYFDDEKQMLHFMELSNKGLGLGEADFKLISAKMVGQPSSVLDLNDSDSLEAIKMCLEVDRLCDNQIEKIIGYDKLNDKQKEQLQNIFFEGERKFTELQRLDSIDKNSIKSLFFQNEETQTPQNEEMIVDTISNPAGDVKQFVFDHKTKKYYILHKGSVIGLPMNGSGLYFDEKNRVALFVSLVNLGSKNGNLVTLGSAKMLERLDLKDVYKGNSAQGLKEYLEQKGQSDYYKCSKEELTLYLQTLKSGISSLDLELDSEIHKLLGKIKLCFLNYLDLDTPKEISDQLDLIEEHVEEKKNDDISNPRSYNIFLDYKQILTILENKPDLLLGNLDKFDILSYIHDILIDEEMTFDAKKECLRFEINEQEILKNYRLINREYYKIKLPTA
jgi:hypothetical protein